MDLPPGTYLPRSLAGATEQSKRVVASCFAPLVKETQLVTSSFTTWPYTGPVSAPNNSPRT